MSFLDFAVLSARVTHGAARALVFALRRALVLQAPCVRRLWHFEFKMYSDNLTINLQCALCRFTF